MTESRQREGRTSRWLATLALAPFAPRRVLRLWDDAGLAPVLGIHLVFVVVAVVLQLGIWSTRHSFDRVPLLELPAAMIGATFALGVGELLENAAIGAMVVAGVAIWAALVSLPWAWRNERWLSTLAHALRTIWLLSAGWLLPYIVARVLIISLEPSYYRHWAYGREEFSDIAWGYHLRPWIDIGWVWWSAWVIWHGVTADRTHTPVWREATCEACGYSLSHLPAGDRCPECGCPLGSSLGLGHRRPCAWELARGSDRLWAFWRCGYSTIRNRREFFSSLAMNTPSRGPFGFLLLVFALLAASTVFARIVVTWISDEPDPLLIRSLVHPVISTFMFVLVLWLNATAVFGMIVSLACRRNLFGPSGRIAAYTSGWLVPWMILLVVVPVSLFEWLGDNALMGKFGHVWIVAWLSCHALMLVVYVSINARSVAHIRYVNFDDGTITPIAGERPSA